MHDGIPELVEGDDEDEDEDEVLVTAEDTKEIPFITH